MITLDPSPIIIVEGLFLFEYKEVYELLDFSIFMDVDHDVQLDRRLYRDQETRGYSREAIMYQWKNHVIPCYEKYLAPYIHLADFVFENDQQADLEFERLIQMLTPKLLCLKE